ncbi:TRAP transporter substrate-binding protein DctP [Oceanicola sp. S124]|uniref:TRAP transporter substrate-binding protein DctP n=1 Tax=Oceanicola sp. S124 TaxID=1042378 RepID=UPI00025585AD|nr:TRAP transporter substrate-binding protein DctP [Oceanicola sp. S124]
MIHKSFRNLTAAALAMVAFAGAASAQVELIFSDVNPADVPRSKAMTEIFAKELGDDFAFQPYFGATLMKQGTELVGLQRGNIQMAGLPPSDLAQQAPEFDILGAAYVVRDQAHLKAIFDSEVGDQLKAIARDKLKVEILGTFYYGTRHLNLKGDAEYMTPADLAGVKLRMPGGESWQFLGKSLGANPVPIPYTELYTALQSGVVDGQDNPLPNNRQMKFDEVTDQIVLTGHNVGFGMLLISSMVWDDLSDEQKATLQAAADKATAWSDQQYLDQEAELVAYFEGEGLKVYTPDLAAFQAYAQEQYLASPLSANWPEGMVEAINGL